MQFGLDTWICEKIISVLQQFPLIEKAVIFGSRATGKFKNYSDIDLAIYAPEMSEEQFAQVFVALQSLPFLYTLDIVRMETLHNNALREKITTEGIVLYSKNERPQ